MSVQTTECKNKSPIKFSHRVTIMYYVVLHFVVCTDIFLYLMLTHRIVHGLQSKDKIFHT